MKNRGLQLRVGVTKRLDRHALAISLEPQFSCVLSPLSELGLTAGSSQGLAPGSLIPHAQVNAPKQHTLVSCPGHHTIAHPCPSVSWAWFTDSAPCVERPGLAGRAGLEIPTRDTHYKSPHRPAVGSMHYSTGVCGAEVFSGGGHAGVGLEVKVAMLFATRSGTPFTSHFCEGWPAAGLQLKLVPR